MKKEWNNLEMEKYLSKWELKHKKLLCLLLDVGFILVRCE